MIKYLIIGLLLIALSTLTPMFSWTVGYVLGWIGDWYGKDDSTPSAYVILGGGLTERSHNGKPLIVLNNYTVIRTQTLWRSFYNTPLPIITSGVESPWIIDGMVHLAKKDGITLSISTPEQSTYSAQNHAIIISENASMNTCENARFSAYLIDNEKKNNTNLNINHHVYLISDWYHMARARRQFALANLATTPIVAPMPTQTAWSNPSANFDHSRRAFYESVALLRDIFKPQKNCRNPDLLGVDTLKTPRRYPKTF